MLNNIVIRALLAIVVAFLLLKYLLPMVAIPNPINWILGLLVVLALIFWVIRGNDSFTSLR